MSEKDEAFTTSRTKKLIVRTIQWAPVVAFMFSGCTCNSTPPPQPTPIPTAMSTPTLAPQASEPATPEPPKVSAAAEATAASKTSACERYVTVLSGRGDPQLLNTPDVRELAAHASELVMCAAVRGESDDLCQRLMPTEAGPTMECRRTAATFREMRDYPNGRSFLFNEVDWEDCQGLTSVAPTFCDTLRAAMRSGDAKDCAQTGDGESICRAYLTLDKSLCKLKGKLAEAEITLADGKGGPPAKVKLKGAIEAGCREVIETRAFLAQGLKKLAESGPPRERELAKAALGDADACASLAKSAMDACTAVAVAELTTSSATEPTPSSTAPAQ